MSILARSAIRQAAVAAISTVTGITVDSPGDWAVESTRMPNIKLRCTSERKTSVLRQGPPEFTTVVTLELIATLQSLTAEQAQADIEALGFNIENALFCWQPLVQLLNQFSGVATESEITAQGEQHIARIRMSVDCETVEYFDPTQIFPNNYPALSQVNVNVDTDSPFDPTGTYSNPPFPAVVVPAPRTTGPDGRNEGTLQINLPSS